LVYGSCDFDVGCNAPPLDSWIDTDTFAKLVMLLTYIDAVLLLIYADLCIDYLPKTYFNDYLPILLGHLLLILI